LVANATPPPVPTFSLLSNLLSIASLPVRSTPLGVVVGREEKIFFEDV
jgi:hypothetical protein